MVRKVSGIFTLCVLQILLSWSKRVPILVFFVDGMGIAGFPEQFAYEFGRKVCLKKPGVVKYANVHNQNAEIHDDCLCDRG